MQVRVLPSQPKYKKGWYTIVDIRVSQQIIEVLEFLGEKFGIAVDWSSDTLIPIAKELCAKYISWEITTSIVWGIIGIILMAIGTFLLIKAIKNYKQCNHDSYYNDDIVWSFAIVGCVLLTIIGLIIIFTQVFDIVRCYRFPELQIYNYINYIINTQAAR